MLLLGSFVVILSSILTPALADDPLTSDQEMQPLTLLEQQALADRFRPYIKTTNLAGVGELFRPCNWDWFLGHFNLIDSKTSGHIILSARPVIGGATPLLSLPDADVTNQATDVNHNPDFVFSPATSDAGGGEPWSAAVAGHGFYAHVEKVPNTHLINIEYTILWAANEGGTYHQGDLTSMTVVYDRRADLLTRVTYSMHGAVLEAFRLTDPEVISFSPLGDMNVAQVSVLKDHIYQHSSDSGYNASDPFVYLARDPDSGRFEHPVAFVEHGSHEFWPNSTGNLTGASLSTHANGDGFSFLPAQVQVLGTLTAPATNPDQRPFIFYNGKWGDDPQPIILHRTWFYPEGTGISAALPQSIPGARFSDPYPYDAAILDGWPPKPAYTGLQVNAYVTNQVSISSKLDVPALPFPDLVSAFSFLPCGGNMFLAAGSYSVPAGLSKHCILPNDISDQPPRGFTVLSFGGPVTLNAPNGPVVIGP
jgi:hypothetical protein